MPLRPTSAISSCCKEVISSAETAGIQIDKWAATGVTHETTARQR